MRKLKRRDAVGLHDYFESTTEYAGKSQWKTKLVAFGTAANIFGVWDITLSSLLRTV